MIPSIRPHHINKYHIISIHITAYQHISINITSYRYISHHIYVEGARASNKQARSHFCLYAVYASRSTKTRPREQNRAELSSEVQCNAVQSSAELGVHQHYAQLCDQQTTLFPTMQKGGEGECNSMTGDWIAGTRKVPDAS
jgi:hypothetical protein